MEVKLIMDYLIRVREGNVYIILENKEVKILNTIVKLFFY